MVIRRPVGGSAAAATRRQLAASEAMCRMQLEEQATLQERIEQLHLAVEQAKAAIAAMFGEESTAPSKDNFPVGVWTIPELGCAAAAGACGRLL